MKIKLAIAALAAALSLGAGIANAAPKTGAPSLDGGTANDERILVEAKGSYNYYGAGPNYYMQQKPGPNCYAFPHPVYGWICY